MVYHNAAMNISPSDFNVVSSLDNDNDGSVTYFCNYCNTKLYYESTDEKTGKKKYVCIKCGIELYPSNELVRKASKFETPQGQNKELLTATPADDDPKASSTRYVARQQNLSPFHKMLEGKGFKWVHYEER